MAEYPKVIVVSGIDTGIGKTVVTGLLARWFKDNGIRAITMKMAQTGCSTMSEDIMEHRKLAGQEMVERFFFDRVSLQGGVGRLSGVFAGAILLSAISTGINILGMPPFYMNVIRGGFIVAAVLLDAMISRVRPLLM